ncbi:hypothetical protein [uncultured Thermanaerothrix sp.]|uniref:hypothetical protein n=1 Tax=uncultured Thermanaerothrix sp. TaxID=1195149 RepID=UPI00261529EC|nr:hypothetical protein [uncultured Thermanaerothrix sp.]
MTWLALFTTPKPFTDPHIARIQRNAIRSWVALGEAVEVILVGDEAGVAEVAREFGVKHVPEVARNAYGTPLIPAIFEQARLHSKSPVLAYVNADILLTSSFLQGAQAVHRVMPQFLIVGQRWDLDVQEDFVIGRGWEEELRQRVQMHGRRHPPAGSDYFIFPRECFQNLPSMAVGRAGWDNWMIYFARRQGWPVVDASSFIYIVHQNHDYRHLPGGQPHYRLPETEENVRLGGGRRTIFTLLDATHVLDNEGLRRAPLTWGKFWREVEVFPLITLRSRVLGWLAFALFHPRKAYYEAYAWLAAVTRPLRRR